jgi:hypothetical protein
MQRQHRASEFMVGNLSGGRAPIATSSAAAARRFMTSTPRSKSQILDSAASPSLRTTSGRTKKTSARSPLPGRAEDEDQALKPMSQTPP